MPVLAISFQRKLYDQFLRADVKSLSALCKVFDNAVTRGQSRNPGAQPRFWQVRQSRDIEGSSMKEEMFLTCTRNSLGRDGRLRKDFVKQTQSIAKQPALSLI